MQVQVIMTSARDLKNVNWRNGSLKPYAVVWIDSSVKCSTKADLDNNVNPVWNEKFTITLPSTSRLETAILHIDVAHAISSPNTKPLVGSVKLPLSAVLMEARARGKVARSLDMNRPSGRPQGIIEIKIRVKDQDISSNDHHKQHSFNNMPVSPEVEPQPKVQSQSQPQVRFHPQCHPLQHLPQPRVPTYGPRYPPVRPSKREQIYKGMEFVGGQAQQIVKQMAEEYIQKNIVETLSNAGANINGQASDGGLGGMAAQFHHSYIEALSNGGAYVNGQSINGQLGGMAAQYYQSYIEALSNAGAYVDGQSSEGGLDGNGFDLGEGFGNGSEPDLSGMGNGSGIDLSGINGGGGANFSGSIYGGGAFARRMYDANESLNTLGKIG